MDFFIDFIDFLSKLDTDISSTRFKLTILVYHWTLATSSPIIFVYQKKDIVKDPMKSISIVPKLFQGWGWGGVW